MYSICFYKLLILAVILINIKGGFAMTRAQLKKTMTIMKNQCMTKIGVGEDKVGNIEQGGFIEDHDVMCYIHCVYKTIQVMKNDRLSKELVMKQVDILYPQELKVPVKQSVEKCIPIQDNYKDNCEAVFFSAKCLYEVDPPSFIFP